MTGRPSNLATTLVTGLAAGALATVVMGHVTTALYERQGRATRRREESARGSGSAYEIAASRLADTFDLHPSKDQVSTAGSALHYALGAGSAAAYGLIRDKLPTPAPVKGLAMGSALWLLADEGAVPALGLTPGPAAFPWQTHARGLVGHLAFGLAVEAVFAVSDRIKAAFA